MIETCTLLWCLTVTYSVPVGVAVPAPAKLETHTLHREFKTEPECRVYEHDAKIKIGRMMLNPDIGLIARIEGAECVQRH